MGVDAGFADLQSDLGSNENVFGAHQLADRLAALLSVLAGGAAHEGAHRVARGRSGRGGGQLDGSARDRSGGRERRRALGAQGFGADLLRARILAGDVEEPLRQAKVQLEAEDTPANRFDYVVLLMTAQRNDEANEQLEILARNSETTAVALRLMGLLEFQQGHLDAAVGKIRQLLKTGKFSDDAFYYLGVIADRRGDPERALRLYSQVQNGEKCCRHCCAPPHCCKCTARRVRPTNCSIV